MARCYWAADDTAMRDKAAYLMTEWAKTLGPDGSSKLGHYTYEKMVCGLVDMHKYAAHPDAIPLLEGITDWAIKNLNRDRIPAQNLEVKWTDFVCRVGRAACR
jgi:hypothetical protein